MFEGGFDDYVLERNFDRPELEIFVFERNPEGPGNE
jgi:hypothetical protein